MSQGSGPRIQATFTVISLCEIFVRICGRPPYIGSTQILQHKLHPHFYDRMFMLTGAYPRIIAHAKILLPSRLLLRHAARVSQPKSIPTESPAPALQEIFRATNAKSRHILAGLGAISQIVFWGNLAQWAGTRYVTKDK